MIALATNCGIFVLKPARVLFPMIRRIRLIGRISFQSNCPYLPSLSVVFAPLSLATLSQEVLIVEQQFIETGSCDVHQAQLSLARGRRSPAPFGNVLPAAARGLDHLIVRARTLVDKPVTKRHRSIVNNRRDLKAAEITIAAARAQPAVRSVGSVGSD